MAGRKKRRGKHPRQFLAWSRVRRTPAREIAFVLLSCPFLVLGLATTYLGEWAGLIGGIVAFATLILLFAPTTVFVGDDGVLITWLGRARFVAHLDINGVDSRRAGWFSERHVSITLRGDDNRAFVVAFDKDDAAAENLRSSIFARSMRLKRMREAPRLPAAVPSLSEPDANGSSSKGSPYRLLGMTLSDCWQVVEHPAAAPHDRGIAACHIGHSDKDARKRFASLARRTAEPSVSRIFELLAKSSDKHALRVLAAITPREAAAQLAVAG